MIQNVSLSHLFKKKSKTNISNSKNEKDIFTVLLVHAEKKEWPLTDSVWHTGKTWNTMEPTDDSKSAFSLEALKIIFIGYFFPVHIFFLPLPPISFLPLLFSRSDTSHHFLLFFVFFFSSDSGYGTEIFIVDSGVRLTHSDFAGRADYLNMTTDPEV